MTRDDIIRMAREAGIVAQSGNSFADDMYFAVLYRFAAIVAEKYKQKIQALEDMVIELQERKE
jgi:hypothetical protein